MHTKDFVDFSLPHETNNWNYIQRERQNHIHKNRLDCWSGSQA